MILEALQEPGWLLMAYEGTQVTRPCLEGESVPCWSRNCASAKLH